MAGCAADESAATSSQDVIAASSGSLEAAYNTSDFNNVWRLEGEVGYFEGTATLVLANATQPAKPLVRKNIVGGGMGIAPFAADIALAETLDSALLPAPGDCIAVTNDPGGRVFTDEELRARKEIGAFAYISDPLSGAPKRPAWGVGEGGRPKVYASVKQCMNDVDRSWSNASPTDKLSSVKDVSEFGAYLQLAGSIGSFEGQASVALVNVTEVTESLVLEKWFETGVGMGVGNLDVVVDIPVSVKAGDCIAVKNVGSGRGFSDDEKRAKDELGTFLYAFSGGDGQEHPAGTNGPKVFRTSAECLKDPAANPLR